MAADSSSMNQFRRNASFVKTLWYEKYLKPALENQQKTIVVVHGFPGCGKSAMVQSWVYQEIIVPGVPTKCYKIQCTDSGTDVIKTSLKSFLSSIGQRVEDKENPIDQVLYVLKQLMALSRDGTGNQWLIVFDDLRVENGRDRILHLFSEHVDFLDQANIKIVVTTREEPRKFITDEAFIVVNVPSMLSKTDAISLLKKFVQEPYKDEGIDDIDRKIHFLPLHLQLLSGLLNNDELSETMDAKVSKALTQFSDLKHTTATFIKAPLENDRLCADVMKTLTMFSYQNLLAELITAVVEELCLDSSYGCAEPGRRANSIVKKMRLRGLCTKNEQEHKSNFVSYTIHDLIRDEIEKLIQSENERLSLTRVAIKAFSRIMPKDGRHHKAEILPIYQKHCESLQESISRTTILEDHFYKLLYADLLTSISYCQHFQKYDVPSVMKVMDEGCEHFLDVLGNPVSIPELYNSHQVKEVAENICNAARELRPLIAAEYMNYIGTVQRYHRLTDRDYDALMKGVEGGSTYMLENGHLSEGALNLLKQQQPTHVINVDTLRMFYPVELLAWHLNILSRVFWEQDEVKNKTERLRQASRFAQLSEELYLCVKDRHDVLIAGYVQNHRNLLAVKKSLIETVPTENMRDELLSLRAEWRTRKEGPGFECGLTKIYAIEQDKHNIQLCLEGELDVLGAVGKYRELDEYMHMYLQEGKQLFPQIIEMGRGRPKLTLSYSYKSMAEFLLGWREHTDALDNILQAMMCYNEYCLKKSGESSGHPEMLPEFSITYKKFYGTLLKIHKSATESGVELSAVGRHLQYLKGFQTAWQRIGERAQRPADADKEYEIILLLSGSMETMSEQESNFRPESPMEQ